MSSVKVNGQGETVELNELELEEFFEIAKGIEYRITGEEEKKLMAAPGTATITIRVNILTAKASNSRCRIVCMRIRCTLPLRNPLLHFHAISPEVLLPPQNTVDCCSGE